MVLSTLRSLETRSVVVQEAQGEGFRARCRVCGMHGCRWRVAIGGLWTYFCEQHEANKDMCAATDAPDLVDMPADW
jgi:hypothetical protein